MNGIKTDIFYRGTSNNEIKIKIRRRKMNEIKEIHSL